MNKLEFRWKATKPSLNIILNNLKYSIQTWQHNLVSKIQNQT